MDKLFDHVKTIRPTSTMQSVIVYWCRRDLRLHDNPALFNALETSKKHNTPFLPVFVLEDYMTAGEARFQFGYPSRYFLSKALPRFAKNFHNFLVLRGKGAQSIIKLKKHFDVEVFVNEDVHPDFYKQLKKLQKNALKVTVFADQMTAPRDVRSGSGNFYGVFTPFKNAIWQQWIAAQETPYAKPLQVSSVDHVLLEKILHQTPATEEALTKSFQSRRSLLVGTEVLQLDSLIQLPDLSMWYTDETSALNQFQHYLENKLSHYKQTRDSLELDAEYNGQTSKMSLALTWGLVSARTLKNRVMAHYKTQFNDQFDKRNNEGAIHYLNELVWREFYKYVLYHQPLLLNLEYQAKFRTIQWDYTSKGKEKFQAWIQGRTGYDIVDAAMNQIAKIGWMHNRARMMVASILSKNLGVDWRWGQEYFRAALIDWDEASNNGGWQWAASVGADPKPIRIFNPYTQAENHDASGEYRKKWLPAEYDRTMQPIVEHKTARILALQRYGLAPHAPARDF